MPCNLAAWLTKVAENADLVTGPEAACLWSLSKLYYSSLSYDSYGAYATR